LNFGKIIVSQLKYWEKHNNAITILDYDKEEYSYAIFVANDKYIEIRDNSHIWVEKIDLQKCKSIPSLSYNSVEEFLEKLRKVDYLEFLKIKDKIGFKFTCFDKYILNDRWDCNIEIQMTKNIVDFIVGLYSPININLEGIHCLNPEELDALNQKTKELLNSLKYEGYVKSWFYDSTLEEFSIMTNNGNNLTLLFRKYGMFVENGKTHTLLKSINSPITDRVLLNGITVAIDLFY
jgi:hypothetical protein